MPERKEGLRQQKGHWNQSERAPNGQRWKNLNKHVILSCGDEFFFNILLKVECKSLLLGSKKQHRGRDCLLSKALEHNLTL